MLHSLRHLAHSAKKVAHPCSTRRFQHSRGGNDDRLALCWLLFSLVMIMYKLHIDNKGMRSRAGIPYETALRDVNIYCTHHALLLISYHYFNTDRPKLRDGDKKNKKKKSKMKYMSSVDVSQTRVQGTNLFSSALRGTCPRISKTAG